MDQAAALKLVGQYIPSDEAERAHQQVILAFIGENPNFLGRSNLSGHVTCSAWVVNPRRNKVLLTHHRALDKWIQLGGHTEEGEDIPVAALREAREESGLEFHFLFQGIFDLDVHLIPPGKGLSAHYHYDIRYLLESDDEAPLVVTVESMDLAWVPLTEVANQETVQRMVRKTAKYDDCVKRKDIQVFR